MDLESVIDELYELRPQDFTAARDARAAEARKEGDRELAARIKELRRPTLSAWASNLLVRRQPDKVQPLISLGEGLREAHRSLDGGHLRELSRQQHALVGALAREARQLAQAEGQPVGDAAQHEIEDTLHAVLADPQSAEEWAAGHLARPLDAPVGFTEAAQTTGAPRKASTERASGAEPGPQDERRHRKLDNARRDAAAAEEKASALETEQENAESAAERAEQEVRETEERVAALAEELKDARRQQKAARESAREAGDKAKAARRAATSARRAAGKAAEAADRLAGED